MRLPRFFGRRDRTVPVSLRPTEANLARRSAKADWENVRHIAAQHRELRARNHFAVTVGKALEGR